MHSRRERSRDGLPDLAEGEAKVITTGGNKIPMNLTVDSEPELVIAYTRPILIPIFEAIEIATPKAHRVITENGWNNTPQLFSHIVRADAKITLDGKRCPVDE